MQLQLRVNKWDLMMEKLLEKKMSLVLVKVDQKIIVLKQKLIL